MHSFLIIGNNKQKIGRHLKTLSRKYSKKQLIFEIKKINDIRQLNSFTKLKVVKPTAIIIRNIDEATTEAQNAFLKNLEEPQDNLIYILVANSIYNLVPTITSRCQIITAGQIKAEKDQVQLTRKYLEKSESEKLLYINSIRKRDQAIGFLEDLILGLHQIFLKNGDLNSGIMLRKAEQTRGNLRANGNVQLQLMNFIVNSDKYP